MACTRKALRSLSSLTMLGRLQKPAAWKCLQGSNRVGQQHCSMTGMTWLLLYRPHPWSDTAQMRHFIQWVRRKVLEYREQLGVSPPADHGVCKGLEGAGLDTPSLRADMLGQPLLELQSSLLGEGNHFDAAGVDLQGRARSSWSPRQLVQSFRHSLRR